MISVVSRITLAHIHCEEVAYSAQSYSDRCYSILLPSYPFDSASPKVICIFNPFAATLFIVSSYTEGSHSSDEKSSNMMFPRHAPQPTEAIWYPVQDLFAVQATASSAAESGSSLVLYMWNWANIVTSSTMVPRLPISQGRFFITSS